MMLLQRNTDSEVYRLYIALDAKTFVQQVRLSYVATLQSEVEL